MLRYKTKSRPGLVALYDIRPGNGAGPFLQPRSPHGAIQKKVMIVSFDCHTSIWCHDMQDSKYLVQVFISTRDYDKCSAWSRESRAMTGLVYFYSSYVNSIYVSCQYVNSQCQQLVSWCFTALSAQIYHAIEVGNISHRAGGQHKNHAVKQWKNTINQHNPKLALFGLGFMEMNHRHGYATSEGSF